MFKTVGHIAYALADTVCSNHRLFAKGAVVGTNLLKASDRTLGLRTAQIAQCALHCDLVLGATSFVEKFWSCVRRYINPGKTKSPAIIFDGEHFFQEDSWKLNKGSQNFVKGVKDFLSAVKFYTDSTADSSLKMTVDSVKTVWDAYDGLNSVRELFSSDKNTHRGNGVSRGDFACKMMGAVANIGSGVLHVGKVTDKFKVDDRVALVFGAMGITSAIAFKVREAYGKSAV